MSSLNTDTGDAGASGSSSLPVVHVLVGALAVGIFVFFFLSMKRAPYKYTKKSKAKVSEVVKKKTVLFTGPSDSGKTTMIHQVCPIVHLLMST